MFEGGAAFTSLLAVRLAVTKVCDVRRVKMRTVTRLLDTVYATKCKKLLCDEKGNKLKELRTRKGKMLPRELGLTTPWKKHLQKMNKPLRRIWKCLAMSKVSHDVVNFIATQSLPNSLPFLPQKVCVSTTCRASIAHEN